MLNVFICLSMRFLHAFDLDFFKRVLFEWKLLGIIDAFSLVCRVRELLVGTGRKRVNAILIRIFWLFLTNFHFMQVMRLCWILIHF
jgi:hypothetical protein